jgi:hypothetical protein
MINDHDLLYVYCQDLLYVYHQNLLKIVIKIIEDE